MKENNRTWLIISIIMGFLPLIIRFGICIVVCKAPTLSELILEIYCFCLAVSTNSLCGAGKMNKGDMRFKFLKDMILASALIVVFLQVVIYAILLYNNYIGVNATSPTIRITSFVLVVASIGLLVAVEIGGVRK